jgi:hypothetical protein
MVVEFVARSLNAPPALQALPESITEVDVPFD